MPTIIIGHQNLGAVSSAIDNFIKVRSSNKEQQVIERGFDRIYEKVRKSIRVKTGYARSSIRTETNRRGGMITVGAFYGIFLEKGTRHARAFPFFYGNIKAGLPQMIQEWRDLYMIK